MTKSPFFVGVLGAAAWAGGVFVVRPSWASALLLLAPFVIVPMGLRLAATPNRDGRHPASYRAAVWLSLPAAIALMASFAIAPSRLAGVLAFPWLGVTLLAAIFGARRILQRGVGPSEELCIDVALFFLAIGGAWSVLCRGFDRPLGFDGLVATLTAVHFHYAGFALCLFVGLAGRRMRHGVPLVVVVSVIGGVCALAAGIGAHVMIVEQLAGWTLAIGGCLMAAVHLHLATSESAVPRPIFRVLIALSGLCLAGALVLGALFAARAVVFVPWVADLGHMAHVHGSANALGFAMLGAFAWSSAPPRARVADPGIPFSALAAGVRVGADFFERCGAAESEALAPRGLLDSIDEHRRPELPTDRVHATVRAFYERTVDHELVVSARWRAPFRFPARIFVALARVVGQLELPLGGARPLTRVESRLVALHAEKDGRPRARGWVRTREGQGGGATRAMYVAAYATHTYEGTAYMNIAFPLPFPFKNLTSILRMDPLDVGDGVLGVELTTRAPRRTPSDAGIWLLVRLFGALRLPLEETIRVWPTSARRAPHAIETGDFPGATAVARHELRLFGVRYLTLDYLIRPLPLEARVDRASMRPEYGA